MTNSVSPKMAAQTDRGIPLSALSPNYLQSNSTSHTWPFSAIAELVDNAYDPDVNATQFWIDKTKVKGEDCLTFMDNGEGMGYNKMHKMLSFGFSDKPTVNGHVPVGIYGNGFKSGAMRLGKDAIVFSKHADTMCVGLLSQTYLEAIKAENILVPIAMFRCSSQTSCLAPEHAESLWDILRYSLFQTEEELLCELNAIKGPCTKNVTGTRIIIWNLRRGSSDQLEFDFLTDRYDIRIPADECEDMKNCKNAVQSGSEMKYSLRAYCSLLYLKPKMQIVIRGQKVRTELISKSLAHISRDKYRPKIQNIKPIPITFGYNTKSKEQYGLMMYHKNRLIKAYERVACQRKANNNKGVGVVGVIQCNFLKPTHNKQDFDYTEEYRRTMSSLNVKLEEYWKEVHHRLQKKSPIPIEDIAKRPDQNWVQCDDCLRWRKLPDGIDMKHLPDKWFCHMNPDPQFRSCLVEEEPEDSEDEQVYEKTYKQQERNEKLKQAQNRQQMEQEQKKAEQKKITALTKQNADLMRKQQELERQLQLGSTSPRSPTQATPNSTPLSTRLRAAGSRSTDNMPVISNVVSLSTTPARSKRSLHSSAKTRVRKRARTLGWFSSKTPGSPSTSTASPDAMLVLDGDDSDDYEEAQKGAPNGDDGDDDIVVIESNSTPRPIVSTLDLSIVKSEKCNDDTDMDTSVGIETTAAAPLPSTVRQICTQTEQIQAIKEEVENSEGKGEGAKDREKGTCQSETKPGPLPLERITNQGQEKKSVTNVGNETGEVNEAHSTSKATNQTLDSCGVKLELQDNEQSNGEVLAVPACEGETGLQDPAQDLPERDHLMSLDQQQDNLVKLLEATTRERNEYETQVCILTSRVEELERSLQEQVERALKKEESELNAEEQGHKVLYLQAQGEMEQLRRELDDLKREKTQAGVEKKDGGQEGSKGGMTHLDDELVCQVNLLMRELDKRTEQQEELENRLKHLEDENCSLLTCCEGLQKDLEEIERPNEKVKLSVADRGSQTDFPRGNQDESEMAEAGPSLPGSALQDSTRGRPESESGQEDSNTQTYKLRELRHNIARLLVNYVPELDLQQVNFDCDVIDEILSQVLEIT